MVTRKEQLDFIDNLKIFLTSLVIVHHAGQPFGPGGWWFYEGKESISWLGSFFFVNASFFMSLFFFLSGYFISDSVRRKGIAHYARERILRLGIPILFGFLIVIPILMYFYYLNFRNYGNISYFKYFINVYFGQEAKPENWTGPSWPDMNFGHLWFLEHLLFYTLIYLLMQKLPLSPKFKGKSMINYYKVFLFGFCLSSVTFFVRIWHPVNNWTGFLWIIQTEFAHVPHYVFFFTTGLFAKKNNWVNDLTMRFGFFWSFIAIILILVKYFGNPSIIPFSKGGLTYEALLTSFFETYLGVSLIIGLIIFFREKMNFSNIISKEIAKCSFLVYVIHVPVVVLLQYTIQNAQIGPTLRFLVISVSSILLCYSISFISLKLFQNYLKAIGRLSGK